ncbi:phosphomannomutase/phosphoglucomutase [Pajaroellobacter abortibovis]|uniref:Phosphomannomutase n=1 Tax=Pajaroellobacter abortibovis TaxID=1882918 RepID=A0A1L6MUX8_9BACT|nr:phosphomannomutase/phosphoglucomutase [Pajaroellobacter abortibovis]APR99318.1 phosphomannomutase [Pajaroellobacter abortibovis]
MNLFSPHIFREYDIRGVADRDLHDDVVQGIGRSFASLLIEEQIDRGQTPPRVAVARDCRLSGPRIAKALISGLQQGGVRVIDVGVGPTPYLYFSVHHLETEGGIMITGSHNPAGENGFKMMKGQQSFCGPAIRRLRDRTQQKKKQADRRGDYTYQNLSELYVSTVTKEIRCDRTMKVVIDAGNGTGGPLALACMSSLGLDPIPLYCDMDGRFPHHHPDPTVPSNLHILIERVIREGARVGIAYDGDADRLGVIDQDGTIIWGDQLLILFARQVLQKHPGAAIVGEVKCSQTLYEEIARCGGRPILWKTGHSLIKNKMKEEQALLAGEMSGHLFFADRYFGYDDALYASLRLLEILSSDKRSMREMLEDVPRTFTTPELRMECPEEYKFPLIKLVTKYFKEKGFEVVDVDGARIRFPSSSGLAWGLVRASNTGPILVMRFEAASAEERDHWRAYVENIVEEQRKLLTRTPSAV